MDELTPDEIADLLKKRISRTNILFQKIDASSIEETKTVYFKYYFDFSTAIEATILNIINLKYGIDKFACVKIGINNQSVSKYYQKEDILNLLDGFGENITWKEYKDTFMGLCSAFKDSEYTRFNDMKLISEIEAFPSFYAVSRNTRNILAHGLLEQNVKYDNNMLEKFMLSYFILHLFHKTLYHEIASNPTNQVTVL